MDGTEDREDGLLPVGATMRPTVDVAANADAMLAYTARISITKQKKYTYRIHTAKYLGTRSWH
jgi:hypothetical protein